MATTEIFVTVHNDCYALGTSTGANQAKLWARTRGKRCVMPGSSVAQYPQTIIVTSPITASRHPGGKDNLEVYPEFIQIYNAHHGPNEQFTATNSVNSVAVAMKRHVAIFLLDMVIAGNIKARRYANPDSVDETYVQSHQGEVDIPVGDAILAKLEYDAKHVASASISAPRASRKRRRTRYVSETPEKETESEEDDADADNDEEVEDQAGATEQDDSELNSSIAAEAIGTHHLYYDFQESI